MTEEERQRQQQLEDARKLQREFIQSGTHMSAGGGTKGKAKGRSSGRGRGGRGGKGSGSRLTYEEGRRVGASTSSPSLSAQVPPHRAPLGMPKKGRRFGGGSSPPTSAQVPQRGAPPPNIGGKNDEDDNPKVIASKRTPLKENQTTVTNAQRNRQSTSSDPMAAPTVSTSKLKGNQTTVTNAQRSRQSTSSDPKTAPTVSTSKLKGDQTTVTNAQSNRQSASSDPKTAPTVSTSETTAPPAHPMQNMIPPPKVRSDTVDKDGPSHKARKRPRVLKHKVPDFIMAVQNTEEVKNVRDPTRAVRQRLEREARETETYLIEMGAKAEDGALPDGDLMDWEA